MSRLFAPEHGTGGGHQDMVAVSETVDPLTGIPVVSLYGDTLESLTPRLEWLQDLDVLVADLMDVGARYYTFAATVIRALETAGKTGLRVLVADRPNPLGGCLIEGNRVAGDFQSFVGELPVANRHGLTVGELCLMAVRQKRLDVDLQVVPSAGWKRDTWWDETGLPWVLPSPNMPTIETATVYPGSCLIEGTNLSEGRGTTRPFELVGAPWLDGPALARRLSEWNLPGCAFRAVRFLPGFQKHQGRECQGVQIHVTHRGRFRPVLTGLALVIASRQVSPEHFQWRTDPYEFVNDRLAFDLLAGGSSWRKMIESGADPRDIEASWQSELAAYRDEREEFLIYPS